MHAHVVVKVVLGSDRSSLANLLVVPFQSCRAAILDNYIYSFRVGGAVRNLATIKLFAVPPSEIGREHLFWIP